MIIKQVRDLMGPNIWTNHCAIEAWVDLGKYEDFPSNTLPGFNQRLERWLPGLIEHRCSIGERGGFLKRLADGTWLGHILEHVTLELQSLSHLPVGFGRARETSERGVYKVAIECRDATFARRCLDAAHRLVMAAAEQREFDIQSELAELTEFASKVCLSPSAQAIVSAAEARGIPAIRLWSGDLVQLGYGSGQQRIGATETQQTGAVGQAISQDWVLTRSLLSTVGLPVVEGRKVKSKEDAWLAAVEIEGLVVVRTPSGNFGDQSSEPLTGQAEIEAAYERLHAQGNDVLVERYIPGKRYRVLVVGDRAVAASTPAAGERASVAPASAPSAANTPAPMLSATSTPLAIGSVTLASSATLESTSVDAAAPFHDVTERMHPDVAASCVLAAQTVGLDIAGVDLVTSDLALTLHASGGAILEVVARPSLREYMRPLSSRPRPVGEAVVEHLFGVEEAIDCTVAAVSGTAGKTNVVGLLSAMAGAASKRVGVADSHRLTIAGRTIGQGDQTHFDAARRVLTNPFVDTAILEVDESNVLDAGIAFGRCDVAIVTNLGQGDHLGRKYVEQLVTIRKAVRAPADVVVPSGYAVLNADDPEVITMDERCRGKLMYFSKRGISAPVRELVNKGGRAVVAVEDRVVYLDGGRTEELFTLQRFACPVLGLPPMLLENLLAATAGAIALGLPRNAIVQGLERALGNDGIALFERDKRMVLVTPSRSLIALGEWAAWLAKRFPSARRLALFEAPTDWRADDVASAENVLFSQFFSVGLVRSSAGNTPSDAVAAGRSTAPADLSTFETLDAALVDQISRLGPEDLLFVPPVSSDQYRRLVSQLVEFGFGRRKTGGLASVESCR